SACVLPVLVRLPPFEILNVGAQPKVAVLGLRYLRLQLRDLAFHEAHPRVGLTGIALGRFVLGLARGHVYWIDTAARGAVNPRARPCARWPGWRPAAAAPPSGCT